MARLPVKINHESFNRSNCGAQRFSFPSLFSPFPPVEFFGFCACALIFLCLFSTTAFAADANRLTYLDDTDPFYVQLQFPRLATPQWVGESGIETVVVLGVDDMRTPAPYETFLRPILER